MEGNLPLFWTAEMWYNLWYAGGPAAAAYRAANGAVPAFDTLKQIVEGRKRWQKRV